MSDTATATLPADITSPTSSLEKNVAKTVQGMQDAEKTIESGIKDKGDALKKETAEIEKQRGDVRKFQQDNPFPHPDVKPFTEKPPQNDPMKAFGSWASAFGIIAGAVTKTGLASSLNASAAAITAFRKNDMDAYEEAKKSWKENTEASIKNAEWEAKGYAAAFDLMKEDHSAGMAQFQSIAAQADNQVALGMAKQNNLKGMYDLQKGLADFAAQGPERQLRIQELSAKMEDTRSRAELLAKWTQQHPDAKPEEAAQMRTQIMNPQYTINQAKTLAEGTGGGATALTDDAILDNAKLYNSGAQLSVPKQGKAGAAAWNKILNKSAELRRSEGRTLGDTVADRKELHSQGLALDGLIKQKSALEPFENNAIKNAKVLQDLANKIDHTGIPVLERWIRAGAQNIAGDQDVTNFNAQMQVFLPEVAKILNNPTLGGVLTDSAREETQGLIPKGTTAKQLQGIIPLLEGDFKRRSESLDDEIDLTKKNIRLLSDSGGESSPAKAGTSFKTEADAAAAFKDGKIKVGDTITIDGTPHKVEK